MTSQIQVDAENAVWFEVVTKSNGVMVKSTKRSYANFKSLDDMIAAKYSRQIREGVLNKD